MLVEVEWHCSWWTALGGLLSVLLADSCINLGHVHHQVLDTHRVAPLVVVPERRQVRQLRQYLYFCTGKCVSIYTVVLANPPDLVVGVPEFSYNVSIAVE